MSLLQQFTLVRIGEDSDDSCSLCSLDQFIQDESVEHIGFGFYSQSC